MTLIMLTINGGLIFIISSVMEKTMIDTEHKYLSEIVEKIGNTAETTVFEYISVCDVLAKDRAIIQVLQGSDENNPMADHPSTPEAVEAMSNIMESYGGKLCPWRFST